MSEMRAKLVVSADASQVVTGLRQAENALDTVAQRADRLGQSFGKAGGSARAGVRDLVEATTGVNRSMTSAAASAEVFGAALDEQERRYKALRASIDPVWRAEQTFVAAQAELNRALRTGVVEAGEAAAAMRRLEAQYETAKAAALAMDQAQGLVGRGARRAGAGLQQASFQIADLATQWGAGTAASVALGQQLPQLLGAFGVFGAVAGAAVAIGVPMVSMLFEGADGADALDKSLQRLETSTAAWRDALEAAKPSLAEMRGLYGDLGDEMERLTGLQLTVATAQTDKDMRDFQKKLAESLGGISRKKEVFTDLGFWGALGATASPQMLASAHTTEFERAVRQAGEQLKISTEGALAYVEALERLGSARGPKEQEAALRAMMEALVEGAGGAEKVVETLGGPDGLWSQVTAAHDAAMQRLKDGTADAYAAILETATERSRQLEELAQVRALAEERLASAIAEKDVAAAASARLVIDAVAEQIPVTIDVTGRMAALEAQLALVEQAAANVAFDRDGQVRWHIEMVRDLLEEAHERAADLGDANLTGIEDAMKGLAHWVDLVAKRAGAARDILSRASVSAYQEYGRSRLAGAGISSSDAVAASRQTIIHFEGKADVGNWDENANRAGYGSSTVTLADGSIQEITAGMRINWQDAERDLDRRILGYHEELRRTVGADVMGGFTPRQIGAIASIQHNYGSIPNRIKPALQTGDAQLIAQAIAGLAMDYTRSERAQGKTARPLNYNRRMEEASAFGDVSAARGASELDLDTRAARARDAKHAADERARDAARSSAEAQRETERRSAEDQRWRDSVTGELDKLSPSYDRAIAAAERWRDQALAGLDRTKAGYEQFAGEVEAIYLQRIAKARDEDLERQEGWAAGVRRALAGIEEDARSWADFSADLVTGVAEAGEEAWVQFARTGKASFEDLADTILEQLARMTYQIAVQPLLNQLFNAVSGGLGIGLGGDVLGAALGAAGAPVSLPTSHTGGSGVMRTYSSGNRMRSDERLAMLREGETVLTERMMENTGALVSILGGLARQPAQGAATDSRPVIQIINQSSRAVEGEVQERQDERGRRQYQLVLSDAVAGALTVPGGRAAQTLKRNFGVRRQGPVR